VRTEQNPAGALPKPPPPREDLSGPARFQSRLTAVMQRLRESANIEEIERELASALCDVFHAERITMYAVSEDRKSIVSRVKSGLDAFREIRLAVNDQSIAGYVAAHRRVLNLRDVNDESELRSHTPPVSFLRAVDAKTGYRSRQMLVAPMIDPRNAELAGVLQVINTRSGQPFPAYMEGGILQLGGALALGLRQRTRGAVLLRSKYDALVSDGVLTSEELELAQRAARRKNLDLETVLVNEFGVKVPAIGQALAAYFGVRYEPYKPDRVRPPELLRNLSRDFCETTGWVPLGMEPEGLAVMTLDPEQARASRMVNNVYPKSRIIYTVTTAREFNATLEQFLGRGERQRAGEARQQDHHRRLQAGRLRHPHRALPRQGRRPRCASARTARSCRTSPLPGELPQRARGAHQDHVRSRYLRAPQAAGRQDQVQEVRAARHRAAGGDDTDAGGVEDIVMRILAAGEPIPLDKLGLSANNLKLQGARSRSLTASSSCAARPARARPPRCTRCWVT
jgi:hypothetical protein